jgi:integrase
MTKIHPQNEQIKRKYFERLQGAKGFSVSTIDQVARAISLWDEFTGAEDYKHFHSDRVVAFKTWLLARKNQRTGQPVSLATCHHYLVYLKEFFTWLSDKPGYKSKIALDDVEYLQLDKKQSKIAKNPSRKRTPTLPIIQKLVKSIEVKTEVDRRDRALICWTLISAMRDQAIATLPLGCLNMEIPQVHQDPERGVKTKYSKDILTTLVIFDPSFLDIVKDWVDYLRKEKLYTDQDPVFPATKIEQVGPDSYCYIGEKVEPEFWKSTNSIRAIFKKRFEAAGLEYFTPHAFRRLAINEALRLCKTPAEFKAVSQNFGHENMATTMFDYASLPEEEVESKIKNLTKTDSEEENIEQVMKALSEKFRFTPK